MISRSGQNPVRAQQLLDGGMLSAHVAKELGLHPDTIRKWTRAGLVTPKYLRAAIAPLGDFATCKRCGLTKPVEDCIVVTRSRGKPVREPYVARCKACHARLKRDLRRSRGARPREEQLAGRVRRQAVRRMIAEWNKALRAEQRTEIRREAEELGVSHEAIRWRKKYRDDPSFRAREIERVHRRNAWRDHEIEMRSDGSLTGTVVGRLFASATSCHYCHTALSRDDKTLDHVVPVRQGGLHSIENVVIACRRCNTAKAGRTPEQWRYGVTVRREAGGGMRSRDAAARRERS